MNSIPAFNPTSQTLASLSMNRQVSYNGPLVPSSFPARKSQICTFPFPRTFQPCNSTSSIPSGPLNHPLPPKPPSSKYFFHAYTPPDRDLRIPPANTTSERINRGGCISVNEHEFPPSDHQNRGFGSVKRRDIIALPREDTNHVLDGGCEETSSLNVDIVDPPRLNTFFHAQNHDSRGCELSVSPRCADVEVCHADTNPVPEVPETPRFTCESPGGASVRDKVDDGLMSRCMLYEGEEGFLDVSRSKAKYTYRQAAEMSPPHLNRQVAQDITSNTLYIKVDSARSNSTGRKRPASAALETDEEASGPRTRARARAEALEAFCSLSASRSARPYSAAEEEVLQNLVARGLAWKQIEREFGQLFAKRTLRSLQLHWSRNLKLTALPTRRSKRKRSSLS